VRRNGRRPRALEMSTLIAGVETAGESLELGVGWGVAGADPGSRHRAVASGDFGWMGEDDDCWSA